MRVREIIRELKKLGVPSHEYQGITEKNALLKLLDSQRAVLAAENSIFSYDFLKNNWDSVMWTTVIALALVLCIVKPEVFSSIAPGLRTHLLVTSLWNFLNAGEYYLVFLRLIEILLEWYVVYARASTIAGWFIPKKLSFLRKYLAPTLSIPIDMSSKGGGIDLGPMATTWLCNKLSEKLALYVYSVMLKRTQNTNNPESVEEDVVYVDDSSDNEDER